MKRRIICLFLFVLFAFAAFGAAEELNGQYTDVPSVMTQDSCVSVEADQGCEISLLAPYADAVRLLQDIYDFVWHEGNRPVRYYDADTQAELRKLFPEIDIDSFHMSEFMAQEMKGNPAEDVKVSRLLDVDYQPGQTTAVVLGYKTESGEYRWFPYRADVKELGLITYEIPKEDYLELVGKKIIYHVLTIRVGPRGGILIHEEVYTEQVGTPSKGFKDIVTVRKWYTAFGDSVEDQFSIFLVDTTEPMQEEISRIGEHVADEKPAVAYFPEELQDEAKLMLPDVNTEEMLIYDVVALRAKDYKDTYGDVVTENLFAAAYSPECEMIAFLGFPIEGATSEPYFTWYCLRAESIEDIVEVAFKQLVIPQMETEAAMLVVMSQPIE